ncbi:MAG TPA: radical SAM protein [Magnetococcales bacterium]|nr:radical SAM protein [Magnetococcales bacterium]
MRVNQESLPVRVLSPPDYALNNRRLANGRPVRNVVNTHADRIRLTPLYGCGFSCQYCNYPGMVYRSNTLAELLEGVDMALKDRIHGSPHILVSGGTPRAEEPEYRSLNEIYEALPGSHPELTWDLMLAPRTLHTGTPTKKKYINFLDFLKKAGFSGLSINLEIFNTELRLRHIPEKAKIGIDGYLEFMELAVERFGLGHVRSVILAGLEPMEETLKGVEALAQRGVLPEISPFTADPGAFLARAAEPQADELFLLWEMATELMNRHNMENQPFCQSCSHNIL